MARSAASVFECSSNLAITARFALRKDSTSAGAVPPASPRTSSGNIRSFSAIGRWCRASSSRLRARVFRVADSRSASRSASIRPSMRASTALTSSRSLAARSSRALNAASDCAWEGGLAAVWAAATILLHANRMREQSERGQFHGCGNEGIHNFESGGELVRDLLIGYVVCLGLSIFGD